MLRFTAVIILLLLYKIIFSVPGLAIAYPEVARSPLENNSLGKHINTPYKKERTSDDEIIYIGKHIEYHIDTTGKSSVIDVAKLPHHKFLKGQSEFLNFGFTQYDIWLKVNLADLERDENIKIEDSIFHIDFSMLKDVEFYSSKNGKITKHYGSGTSKPFSTRPINDRGFALALGASIGDILYIRISSSNGIILPISISEESIFYENAATQNLYWGILFGVLIVIAFSNVVIFLFTREKVCIYYFGYIVCVAMAMSVLSGHSFQLFWPNQPDLNGSSISFFTSLLLCFGTLFSISFLRIRRTFPKLYKVSKIFALSTSIVAVLSILSPYDLSLLATIHVAIFGPLVAFICYNALRYKKPLSLLYASAWCIFIFGIFVYAIVVLGVVEATFFRIHLKEFGAICEALILTIGIGAHFKKTASETARLRDKSEKVLAQRNEALERSAKLRDNYFTVITHELRTPLNGIVGALDNLKQATVYSDIKRSLQLADEAAFKMSQVIEDVLLYQELKHKDSICEKINCDISYLLKQVSNRFYHVSAAKGVDFSIESIHLPKFLKIDVNKVFAALFRIVDNAVKYTASGYVKVSLEFYPEIDMENEGGKLCITVKDTGCGIIKSRLDKIFHPFISIENGMSRDYGGLTLGLTIAKYLVDACNGEINITSQHGIGTSVRMSLPCLSSQTGDEINLHWREQSNENSFGSRDYGDSNKNELYCPVIDIYSDSRSNKNKIDTKNNSNEENKRILIVEDNNTNALMLKAFVKKIGYEFDHAENGTLAVECFRNDSFDLILMDLQMPIMDGFEATKRIREIERNKEIIKKNTHIPIIACTANTTMSDRDKCALVGMDGFLEKPVTFKNVKAEFEFWFGRCDNNSENI